MTNWKVGDYVSTPMGTTNMARRSKRSWPEDAIWRIKSISPEMTEPYRDFDIVIERVGSVWNDRATCVSDDLFEPNAMLLLALVSQ